MKKKGEITAFYMETLILMVVMIGILLVLTQILGISRRESIRAKRLTEAVTIAQSAAEILQKTENLEEAADLLGLEAFSVTGAPGAGQTGEGMLRWAHRKEGAVSSEESYRVVMERSCDSRLTEDLISVYPAEGEEPIYSLSVRRVSEEEGAA